MLDRTVVQEAVNEGQVCSAWSPRGFLVPS